MSAALDLGTTVRGTAREDRTIVFKSAGFPEFQANLDGPLNPSRGWTDYPLGVVAQFLNAGHPVGGLDATYSSNLPVGAGLSSSASIEVATAVLLCRLAGIELPRMEVARLCRKAENEFAGVNCGILDQVSSVFGRDGHAIFLDCRDESVQLVPFPAGAELLVVNSGVKHALTGGEYNERREQCFEAARLLGVETLRDATSAQLEAADMPELVKRRALHITGENERVFAGRDALERGDLAAYGALLTASHESSMKNFENSTKELDALVRIATSEAGVLGARLTGGGFGGAIVALVESEVIESSKDAILKRYAQETGVRTEAYRCRLGDGALPGV